MFFKAVIPSPRRAAKLPGQNDGIVLHSTAKFQKTNNHNSLYSIKLHFPETEYSGKQHPELLHCVSWWEKVPNLPSPTSASLGFVFS